MALDVSLGSGDLPPTVVVLPGVDLPTGEEWSLTGTVGAFTWTPRGGSGVGTGEQVVVADALAPLNETVTYTLVVSGAVVDTGQVVRPYTGTGGDGLARDVLASVDATTLAGVRRTGGDARQGERRYHASRVPSARFTPLRLAPVAGAGGGGMTVATVGEHTVTLRGLLDANTLMVYFHDRSRCGLPGCDVPPVEVLYVVDAANDIGARTDVGERVWSLGYLLQDVPEPDVVAPLQTFDDLDAAALTFDDLDALGLTFDEFDRTLWDQVGA